MVAIGSQPDLLTPFVNLVANLSLPLVKSLAQGTSLGLLTGNDNDFDSAVSARVEQE